MTDRPMIDPSFIANHRARRIEVACAECAADKGSIHAVIVADIVAKAGIARNTFYETFRNKADCATATLSLVFDDALEAARNRGVEGLVEFIALNPALARLALFDGIALPPLAEVYSYGMGRFEALLRERYPDAPSDEVYELLVGGAAAMLKKQFREDPAGIMGLAEEIESFVSAPFEVAAC